MTLEELVGKWFVRDEAIAGTLAQYAGTPAVFLATTPADTQAGWGQKTQYPRIVYQADMRADSERKTAGTLNVELMCDISGALPEEIEPEIRRCMKDLLIQPEGGSPYCFAWLRSENFEIQDATNKSKRIVGSDIAFDILEYPDQRTTDPDPVEALNMLLKGSFPDTFILGLDQAGEFRVATDDSPILFVRMAYFGTDHLSYALAWVNCKVAIHVIAPTPGGRAKWLRCIHTMLMRVGETVMTDGTPMRFTGINMNGGADYLTAGQIDLSGQYATYRKNVGCADSPLRDIIIT